MNRGVWMLICFIFVFGCKKNNYSNSSDSSPVLIDIPTDSVILNPSGYAPLSAEIKFFHAVAGKSKIVVLGKNGKASNIQHQFNDYGLAHSIPVIGLYPNHNNTIEIYLLGNNDDSIAKAIVHIQTGLLPPDMPTVFRIDSAHYNVADPGIFLVSNYSAGQPNKPYMMDNWGDIRWMLDYSSSSELNHLIYDTGIFRLRNGNFCFGDISNHKIYEVDMLGYIKNRWSLSGYLFHHEVMEKHDGNFILSASLPSSTNTNGVPTEEDYIIELNRQTGSLVNVWDLKESLDEYRTTLTSNVSDWIHVNGLAYDSTDQSIIISGRTQGVVKLDYNNNVKWILSPHRGWGFNRRNEDLKQFLLKPLDANNSLINDTAVINGSANHPDFEWSWFQHSPALIPGPGLLLFDNGTTRNFVPSTGGYSRAVVYKIDEQNKTVRQVWQYGKERGIETYSSIISSVQYLASSKHIVFGPGYRVVNASGLGGKMVEIDYLNRQPVLQVSVSAANNLGFHRAKKMSAYPE